MEIPPEIKRERERGHNINKLTFQSISQTTKSLSSALALVSILPWWKLPDGVVWGGHGGAAEGVGRQLCLGV